MTTKPRAGGQHLAQAAGVLMRRQRNAAELRKSFDEPFDQRDPIDAGERDIDHGDVGKGLADALEGLIGIRRQSDDRQIGLAVDHRADAGQDDRMVVDHEYAPAAHL
nr:hypothetical protein [Mesorhizobium sp.]